VSWDGEGWACLDLNQGPLPYQLWAPMGRGMIQLGSVLVRVSRVGLADADVAVTAAVSISAASRHPGPDDGSPPGCDPRGYNRNGPDTRPNPLIIWPPLPG
jgi:hypothetical protein